MKRYTKWLTEVASDRKFAGLALGQLTIVLMLGAQTGRWIVDAAQDLPNALKFWGVIASIVVTIIAWFVAKFDDSPITSFIAVIGGVAGYGLWAGMVTAVTFSPNFVHIFALLACVAGGMFCVETFWVEPGTLSRYKGAGATIAVFVFVLFHFGLESVRFSALEAILYAFFAASILTEYQRAFNGEQTLDNAIDLSLEFLFSMFSNILLPFKKDKGEKSG